MFIFGCMYDINILLLFCIYIYIYINLFLLWESWWGFLCLLMDVCKFMVLNLYYVMKEGIL